jgi:uncharacterized protein (TIGR04255 family)
MLSGMDEPMEKLKNAPIVEAVLNIECDMPPTQDIATLQESAKKAFLPQYPKFKAMLMQEHRIEAKAEGQPQMSIKHSLHGLQFLQEDEKQLIQIRSHGFSFNRLAPYTTLDEYLGEMERTWQIFVKLASPVQVRLVQLRYINRILLPMSGGKLELEDYLSVCPRLPDEERLGFLGFLNHHTAIEKDTGNQVNIVLAAQPIENEKLPIIFDITAARALTTEPREWGEIVKAIQSLRDLKNRIFRNTLTKTCIQLFQQ